MAIIKKQDAETNRDMMLHGRLSRIIPTMAIPSVISALVTSFYSLADSFFVSQLGKDAVGAVGIAFTLDNILTMFGMAIGTGASSYIARLLGAKNKKQAEETLAVSVLSSFVIGIIFAFVGLIFQKPIMYALGAREAGILSESLQYSKYLLFATPIAATTFVVNQSLRAEGSPVFSMLGTISGAIVNIGLCPLFVFVLDLGIAGAGMANMISKCVSFLILLFPYIRGRSVLRMSYKNIRFEKSTLLEIGKMGLPVFSQRILTNFVSVTANNAAAGFGVSAIAAISICNRAMQFFAAGLMGLGQGYSPVAGFNWGAERYDRVWDAFWFTFKAGIVVMLIICAPMFVFSKQFIGLFSQGDAEVLDIGLFAIRSQCIAMPIGASIVVVSMTLSALGKASSALLLGLSRQGICYIPMILILPRLFGVYGLAAASAASDFFSVFIGAPLAFMVLRTVREKMKTQEVLSIETE